MGTRTSAAKRLFRIATILLPSWLAWTMAFGAARSSHLAGNIALLLAPIWGLTTCLLIVRMVLAFMRRREDKSIHVAAELDLLTTPGAALAWISAAMIVGASTIGYASLAVVGLLGCGLFHLMVIVALLSLRAGGAPRGIALTRRFTANQITEGDDVIEELTFTAPKIPLGYRLLVTGRVGPRWATTRHVVESIESGAEIVIESEIGPAVRGDHDAEPLSVWLQDSFGVCKSTVVGVGATHLTVLPKVRAAEETKTLLDSGLGEQAARQTKRPTEGAMALREYQLGDDVRRIHWMRSLASRELVVRQPDEAPPERPHVRLVLDTYFPEASQLASDTPAEMLDALVQVWLSVARSLAESGARVTLECALPTRSRDPMNVTKARRDYQLRAPDAAQRFGAQVEWQSAMTVDALCSGDTTYVISRAVLYQGAAPPNAKWILVLPGITQEVPWPATTAARMAFPMGTPDNRWSVRRAENDRLALARRDRGRALLAMRADVALPPPGSFIAKWQVGGAVRLEPVQ